MNINYLLKLAVWFKLGWPFAVAVFNAMSDGKITKNELLAAVDLAIGDDDEIILWKSK